ncbi:hypothetical protein BDAP_000650 [Binucleata daphniae]
MNALTGLEDYTPEKEYTIMFLSNITHTEDVFCRFTKTYLMYKICKAQNLNLFEDKKIYSSFFYKNYELNDPNGLNEFFCISEKFAIIKDHKKFEKFILEFDDNDLIDSKMNTYFA